MTKIKLEDKYVQKVGHVFLTGSQALARLPMLQQEMDKAAGLNTAGFISGYRGSPLGGLDKTLWQAQKYLAEHNIVFQPGVNEDLAATAVWGSQQVNIFEGAQYDGVFGMWYGKGPGVDRSGDVFKHANHAGTSKYGGVLVVAGDDHGCKSSTLPHQTEYAFVDAMIPVLNPSGVQEIIDLGLYGWALSRYSGCWVALKTIAETVDASLSTDIDTSRIQILYPETETQDLHSRWPDKPLEQELRLHNEKLNAVLEFARVNKLNKITLDSTEPRLGIVSCGKSYSDVLQALQDLGIDESLAQKVGLRLYKVSMSWPLEPEGIHEFAHGLDEVLVVEEKRGLIEDQLTSLLYNWDSDDRPTVVGKKDETNNWLLPPTGELTPAVIARVIASRLMQYFTSEQIKERLEFLSEKERYLNRPKNIVERIPHFCSGCPHNTSTVVPKGSRAMGGIGCHYMATWMDRETDTFTQMGGEGATWIGQAPFTDTKHVFQNLGDGTYFHSGLLAIRASIAAKVNITYKILFNDAVAMTGGQAVDGELTVELMSHQLHGEGIENIVIVSDDLDKYDQTDFPSGTTFHHRDDLDAVQTEMRERSGTSTLIYHQTCAAEKRRLRKRGTMIDPDVRPFINEKVCEGCGDCGVASNCLSVSPLETEYGRKRKIEQSSCNKDMSCIKGFCPSFVSVTGGRLKTPPPQEFDFSILPEPTLPSTDIPYGIVLAGVGGTGVTTLGAILGMAAHIEHKGASVLDMAGLAQKFGAVITHLQIAKSPDDIYATRIAAGGAKLVLGCDLVVASANDSMVKVNQNHAHAVINDHRAMTADFTRDPDTSFPASSMKEIIRECVGEENTYFINSSQAVEELMGGSMASNIFLAGYAFQKGLIPISSNAIYEAIELNGVAIKENEKAFNLGRLKAHTPQLVQFKPEDKQLLTKLEDILEDRSNYLSQYQNQALALKYKTRIEEFSQHKRPELTKALAQNYFKILAYKDEYEVARLYSEPEFKKALDAQFEGNYKLTFNLAPPVIAPVDKHTGKPRKMTFGPWMMPVFNLLAKFKFLRGSKFDPFAYTEDRKLERQLVHRYENIIDLCDQFLNEDNEGVVLQLLELPQKIRGYGYVKHENARLAQIEEGHLLTKLKTQQEPVKIMDPHAA
jgi:indolepyruvate ferredoxin oxidoreductase